MFDNNCLPFNCTFVFIKCDYLVKKKNIISRTYITRNLPLPWKSKKISFSLQKFSIFFCARLRNFFFEFLYYFCLRKAVTATQPVPFTFFWLLFNSLKCLIFFFDVNLVMFFFRYPIHFSKLCVSGIVLHLMQARVSEFFPCYMMILYIFVSASITTKMIGVKNQKYYYDTHKKNLCSKILSISFLYLQTNFCRCFIAIQIFWFCEELIF